PRGGTIESVRVTAFADSRSLYDMPLELTRHAESVSLMVPTDPCQVMVESATGEVAVLREGHGTDNATVPVLFRGTRRVILTVVDPDARPVPDVLVNIREHRRTVVTGEVLDPVEVLQRENSRSSLGWMQKLFSGGNQRTIAVSSDGICALDLPVGSYEIMIHMLP